MTHKKTEGHAKNSSFSEEAKPYTARPGFHDPRLNRRRGRRLPPREEKSAGGLVVNQPRNSALLIGKYGRGGRFVWTLPKGHIQYEETAEEAALREITEETGIFGKILAPIGSIEYRFANRDFRVHKCVQHFLVVKVGGAPSSADHEVIDVAWIRLTELDDVLTHPNERRLVRTALLHQLW